MDYKKIGKVASVVLGGVAYAGTFVIVNGILRKVVPIPTKVVTKFLTGFGIAIVTDYVAYNVKNYMIDQTETGWNLGIDIAEQLSGTVE